MWYYTVQTSDITTCLRTKEMVISFSILTPGPLGGREWAREQLPTDNQAAGLLDPLPLGQDWEAGRVPLVIGGEKKLGVVVTRCCAMDYGLPKGWVRSSSHNGKYVTWTAKDGELFTRMEEAKMYAGLNSLERMEFRYLFDSIFAVVSLCGV